MTAIGATGCGANCHMPGHRNAGDAAGTQCQTSIRFAVAGREDQARRAMKRWLLAGLAVDESKDDARRLHMAMRADAVAAIPISLEQEQEMDRQAWALG